ncbi:MAG: hypothetical protein ACI9VI_002671, partial [Candidatus Azotimanducaceae bacterium]
VCQPSRILVLSKTVNVCPGSTAVYSETSSASTLRGLAPTQKEENRDCASTSKITNLSGIIFFIKIESKNPELPLMAENTLL